MIIEFEARVTMVFPKAVRIRELGPREGFQTSKAIIPIEKKLELISALSETGVKDIEITAMVRPDKVPQMADAEEVIGRFVRQPGVRYTALYLNPQGFIRAEQAGRLDNEAWLYGAVSETFLQRNANTTLAQTLAVISEWLAAFRAYKKDLQGLMLSTAFGCNYEGEISAARALDVIRRFVDAVDEQGSKLREVCLADTMGWATPEMMKRLVAEVKGKYPAMVVSLHLHDTRGSGMANVYAGLQEGVECFDGSVGGLGGCPFARGAAGNVCTEDMVFLCRELGIETGINIEAYIRAAQLAESIMGAPLPGKLYKSA